MKNLMGKVRIELTLEDANYIKGLIERDKAKPMKEYEFDVTEGKMAICPCCERAINTNFAFCGWCGQHIDNENYEL